MTTPRVYDFPPPKPWTPEPTVIDKTGPIRAVLAVGLGGSVTVIATDSNWIADDCEVVADHADDIGLDFTPAVTADDCVLWLWEGTGKLVGYSGPDAGEPPEPEYTGKCRPLTDPAEIAELLKMKPPARCVVCNAPATRTYGEDDPWCGTAECARQMFDWGEEEGAK